MAAATTIAVDEFTMKAITDAAKAAGMPTDEFGSKLVTLAADLLQKGRLDLMQGQGCESPEMHADLLSVQGFGIWFESGEEDEAEGHKARSVIEEELHREDISPSFRPDRSYELGLGAGWIGIMIAVVAVFAALKNVDGGLHVLGKWTKAIRRAAGRVGAKGYTAEFLKAICVEDVGTRLGSLQDIEPSMVTCIAALGGTPMEAATLVSHYTVTVPIPNRRKAFVYVITQLGEILDSAELNYPVPDTMLDDAENATQVALPPGEGQ